MEIEKETQKAMNFAKQNKRSRLLLALLLLAAVGMTQCIGVAYGRYNSSSSDSMKFVLRESPRFYLFSGRTEDGQGLESNRNWIPDGNGMQTLSLCVSNTDQSGGNTATDDLAVRIRLFVPEGTESDEMPDSNGNLHLMLRTESDGKVYEAVSAYLSTLTPLYQSIETKGWIYSFISPDSQSECIWTLPGGVVSDLEITLISEENAISPDGFRLYVDRVGIIQ